MGKISQRLARRRRKDISDEVAVGAKVRVIEDYTDINKRFFPAGSSGKVDWIPQSIRVADEFCAVVIFEEGFGVFPLSKLHVV